MRVGGGGGCRRHRTENLTPESITEYKRNTRTGEIYESKVAEHSRYEDQRMQRMKADVLHENKIIIRKPKELALVRATKQAVS